MFAPLHSRLPGKPLGFAPASQLRGALPDTGEVYLHPGDVWFGAGEMRLRTTLGSCVAITLWHPRRRLGGMCHFMLPSRHGATAEEHDGRYADEAVALLLAAMRKHGCQPEEFQAKLFGGGQMFERLPMVVNVAQQNVTAARALMAGHEFKVIGEHVGGQGHRQIMLDLNCGKTWLQHRAQP